MRFCRCAFYSLTAVISILGVVCVGVWIAGAAFPTWSVSTLLGLVLVLVYVAVAVTVVCAFFWLLERITGPLVP